jgi:starch phosphorylase
MSDKTLFQPPRTSSLTNPLETRVEDDRTGMSPATFRRAFLDNLYYLQGVPTSRATPHDIYMALSYTIRDRLLNRWHATIEAIFERKTRAVAYLSAEFLLGRQLTNGLLNARCWQQAMEALDSMGVSIYDIIEQEPDPGLGNGGLGRLAACFMDSLATLEIPAIGYGIRYEYGIFRQEIVDGWQVERPDLWLAFGNPWEIRRPQLAVEVFYGGRTEHYQDESGRWKSRWIPETTVLGIPHDTMVPGFGTEVVNTVRLWGVQASQEFDFALFNAGDYSRAVAQKNESENLTKVLYPNDNTPQGRELRFKQQYFFVACCLQNILRNGKHLELDLRHLPEYVVIQLNDTHPAVAVAELMRLLIDEEGIPWDDAWESTRRTFAYTNHTLLPEALEKWPSSLFRKILPRHFELIQEINQRFLDEVRVNHPLADTAALSIFEEGSEQQVRMANLASVGSFAINGVAALHTELLKQSVSRDFYNLEPGKFSNKTNGVTPRRFLFIANPKLTQLLVNQLGRGWLTDLEQLRLLEQFRGNEEFLSRWDTVRQENKRDVVQLIKDLTGIEADADSLFDTHIKRIHEYKRQLLNVLHVITLYNRIKNNSGDVGPKRTVIFAGKAAPGYFMAKLIIKLIHDVAHVVNNDREVSEHLKVVFVPNFSVSSGEVLYAGTDLSEQISTAGKEASGTGNMKFALNGALTIGTLDGANVEIRDAVGAENFFLFGKTVEELTELRKRGYRPRDYYERDHELRTALDELAGGRFSPHESGRFHPIVDSLLNHDEYFLLADYRDYVECQSEVGRTWQNHKRWREISILNTARSGFFSSDRTIQEYNRDIWKATPIKVKVKKRAE